MDKYVYMEFDLGGVCLRPRNALECPWYALLAVKPPPKKMYLPQWFIGSTIRDPWDGVLYEGGIFIFFFENGYFPLRKGAGTLFGLKNQTPSVPHYLGEGALFGRET